MKQETESVFLNECKSRFDSSFQRLYHCLDQLDEKQLWWRPNDNMNSVAVLVKHICGAFRQWTITQINGTEDQRNRPQEFLNDNAFTKTEIRSLAERLKSDFTDAIQTPDASRLTEPKKNTS